MSAVIWSPNLQQSVRLFSKMNQVEKTTSLTNRSFLGSLSISEKEIQTIQHVMEDSQKSSKSSAEEFWL